MASPRIASVPPNSNPDSPKPHPKEKKQEGKGKFKNLKLPAGGGEVRGTEGAAPYGDRSEIARGGGAGAEGGHTGDGGEQVVRKTGRGESDNVGCSQRRAVRVLACVKHRAARVLLTCDEWRIEDAHAATRGWLLHADEMKSVTTPLVV